MNRRKSQSAQPPGGQARQQIAGTTAAAPAAANTLAGRAGSGAPSAQHSGSVAVAAAVHNFTDQVIATWSPYVVRRPRVLVPIHVDALVVRDTGDTGDTWADCRMQPPNLSATAAQANTDLLAAPFTNLDATTDVPHLRARGVHLHWALPDALTLPDQTPLNNADPRTPRLSATYPPIPDRWLVARIFPSPRSTKRTVRGWVLETGLPDPVTTDVGTWTEHGWVAPPKQQHMTVLGYGDPTWAAYYDNVAGRLGFHDDLSDVPQGPVAYLVCGWYANPALDPLGKVPLNSFADFYSRLADLGWMLQDDDASEALQAAADYAKVAGTLGLIMEPMPSMSAGVLGSAAAAKSDAGSTPSRSPSQTARLLWPDQILCHGSVVNVSWPNPPSGTGAGTSAQTQTGETGGPPLASALTVSIGGTLPEAMAALISARQGNDQLAYLLEAFHAHVLHELDAPDGLAKLDSALHATRFGSMPGGFVTETMQQSVPEHPPYVPPAVPTPQKGVAGIVRAPGGAAAQVRATSLASTTVQQSWMNTPVTSTRSAAESAESARPMTQPAPRQADISAVANPGAGATSVTVERSTGVRAGNIAEASAVVREGGLGALLGELGQPQGTTTTYTTKTVEVQRALPRFFHPQDPVLLVEGGQRTFKHGYDDIHTDQGKLVCRLTGSYVTGLGVRVGQVWVPLQPQDVLQSGLSNGSLPMECESLLLETIALDPGSAASFTAAAIVGASPSMQSTMQSGAFEQSVAVEQTAWQALRDPKVDPTALVANSGLRGRLPSPVAITLAAPPWLPRHLDWEVAYIPSPKGADDWTLDEIDYRVIPAELPSATAPAVATVAGRTPLTGGAASSMAGAVRKALDELQHAGTAGTLAARGTIWTLSQRAQAIMVQLASFSSASTATAGSGAAGAQSGSGGSTSDASADETGASSDTISAQDASQLADLATLLDAMDVLSGGLDSLRKKLRDQLAAHAGAVGADLEAGFMRITRLRLVDGFGQFVDLGATPSILKAGPLAVDGRADLVALPPRFAGRSRLWARFTKSDEGPDHHGDLKDIDVNPLCGFLMPNHLDGALTFYDATGQIMGAIEPQWGENSTDALPLRLVWEDAPGRPATVGAPPSRALPNRWLGGIADALLAWGRTATPSASEHAVSALLRVIDSTRWTVDPFGHTGEEHLALLVGHPVAVLRARLRLEVEDYAPQPPASLGASGVTTVPGGPDGNWTASSTNTAIPLRLGALAHWQDGLFGYFVNDDYTTLCCVDAAAADFARPIGPMQGFLQAIGSAAVTYEDWTSDLGPDPDAGAGSPPSQGSTPVRHPYINTSGVIYVQPNQDVWLTLLVEPHTLVHATAGLLPRKDLAIRREWVQDGLAKLAPTFRFGPVLVDPKTVRMPIPSDLQGSWSWDHRQDMSNWHNDQVTNATDQAQLSPDPCTATEGWLQLVPPNTPPDLSLSKGGSRSPGQ